MLEWRLEAYRRWLTMTEPTWARVALSARSISRTSTITPRRRATPAPKIARRGRSGDSRTYEKLGIPLREQEMLAGVEPSARVAVDAVFDSVSVATTFKDELTKAGVIFCSISEAVREHPDLVRKYLGTVVPATDNFYATLTRRSSPTARSSTSRRACAARWSCRPISASTRQNTGQFERTLIIADKGAYVSYLEGCTAPKRDENQLHAAVVELIALDDAEIKYSTVQNWYPGDSEGKGGIYNFVTKRGDCRGEQLEDFLDAGRDRLGDHLEISVLHPARRRFARRVLFDRHFERPPAGR